MRDVTNTRSNRSALCYSLAMAVLAMYSPMIYFVLAEPAFTRSTAAYTPIIPSILCVMVLEASGVASNFIDQATVLIGCQILFSCVCWAVVFLAWRRAWYWTISAVTFVFGVSAYSHFILFALWSM